jgi:hypothetical protein
MMQFAILPSHGFASSVAEFRGEFRQAVAQGGFFVGRHSRTMTRSARSVQRLSARAV